ncbi:transposase [Nonomuraea dietziae]|uniref:transposase n=1 Tax=Nonomuraea dietziae TaxID=65515 RepID=UPI00342E6E69
MVIGCSFVGDPGLQPWGGKRTRRVAGDGQKIANPGSLAERERDLARYLRRTARKAKGSANRAKGSANRAKAEAKVAHAPRNVRASRADFPHKTSTRLVRAHDVIVIEDPARPQFWIFRQPRDHVNRRPGPHGPLSERAAGEPEPSRRSASRSPMMWSSSPVWRTSWSARPEETTPPTNFLVKG